LYLAIVRFGEGHQGSSSLSDLVEDGEPAAFHSSTRRLRHAGSLREVPAAISPAAIYSQTRILRPSAAPME
jgi:hypothetical protein